jgi:hypothetical protein
MQQFKINIMGSTMLLSHFIILFEQKTINHEP